MRHCEPVCRQAGVVKQSAHQKQIARLTGRAGFSRFAPN